MRFSHELLLGKGHTTMRQPPSRFTRRLCVLSHARTAWLKAHNHRVKRDGGCRVVVCPLPSKSPWLNRIEPKWVHGKRAIAEPDRKLGVDELKHRICAYYDCELLDPITH